MSTWKFANNWIEYSFLNLDAIDYIERFSSPVTLATFQMLMATCS